MVTIYCDACDAPPLNVAVRPDDVPAAGLYCPCCGTRVPPNRVLTAADFAPPAAAGMIDHDPEDWLAEAAERIARHPFSPQSRSGGY